MFKLVSLCTTLLVLALAPHAFAQAGDFSQSPTSPEPAGENPFNLAIGEFNGDGDPDLAVGNVSSDDVTIMLGDGAGDFTQTATSPYPTGNAPNWTAVGHFNADDDQDLAVVSILSEDITILLGEGDGSFTEAPTSPLAAPVDSFPRFVAVADFDEDGEDDLAVAKGGSGPGDVSILLGEGDGDFSEVAGPFATGADPKHIEVADYDNNDHLDLAVANNDSANLTVLLGDGTGDFAEAATSPEAFGGAGPYGLALGQFNADDEEDLAMLNLTSNDVDVLLANPGVPGDFTSPGFLSPGAGANAIVSADFDLDGDGDLAITRGSEEVGIFGSDGNGAFDEVATSPEAAGNSPSAFAAGDLDLDGDADLAVANYFSNDVTVLLNQTRSPSGPPDPDPTPTPDAGDTVPPDTEITGAPKRRAQTAAATFEFVSTEPGSTFECRKLRADKPQTASHPFLPCTSPRTYELPRRGKRVFEVRATDAAGNTDPTPATHTWKVRKKK